MGVVIFAVLATLGGWYARKRWLASRPPLRLRPARPRPLPRWVQPIEPEEHDEDQVPVVMVFRARRAPVATTAVAADQNDAVDHLIREIAATPPPMPVLLPRAESPVPEPAKRLARGTTPNPVTEEEEGVDLAFEDTGEIPLIEEPSVIVDHDQLYKRNDVKI